MYHKPASGDAWGALEDCHGGACIAAMEAYSDKTCVNFKGATMWAFRLAFLNADLKVSTCTVHSSLTYNQMNEHPDITS